MATSRRSRCEQEGVRLSGCRSFAACSIERPLRSETVAVAAVIEDSFYAAGRAAGLPHATLAEMIKLLKRQQSHHGIGRVR